MYYIILIWFDTILDYDNIIHILIKLQIAKMHTSLLVRLVID